MPSQDMGFSFIGRGVALSSQPTVEMRAELEKAGVKPPDDDDQLKISTLINAGFEKYRVDQGERVQGTMTWGALFRQVDADGSGVVTFDELEDCIRGKLKIDKKTVSSKKLKALWCALDADDSNQLEVNELASFLQKGKVDTDDGTRWRGTANANKPDGMGFSFIAQGEVIESQPTTEMRAELEANGVSLPGDSRLEEMSEVFNKKLSDAYKAGQSTTKIQGNALWYQLFREVDEDGSGYVTFDEFEVVARRKLAIKKKDLTGSGLKALWCALDADDSNRIEATEFRNFLKLGEAVLEKDMVRWKSNAQGNKVDTGFSFIAQGAALASKPTAQMREEMAADGREPADEETQLKISKYINQGFEDLRTRMGERTDHQLSWGQIWKMIDADDSGVLTFDELEKVVRHMIVAPGSNAPCSVKQLEALWCALDVDDSDSLEIQEFVNFLKSGKIEKSNKPRFGGLNTKRFETGQFGYVTGGALAQQPTSEMRAELEQAGVELPTDEELKKISLKMNQAFEDMRIRLGTRVVGSISWGMLLKEFDSDGSGTVTYDEVKLMIRKENKLRLNAKVMPESTIKALFCRLDEDNSNALEISEFASFLKLGELPKIKGGQWKGNSTTKPDTGFSFVATGAALDVTATKVMREEIAKAGVELPTDDELTEYAKSMNLGLTEQTKFDKRHSGMSWFSLFKMVDADGSGVITYDEFKKIVRGICGLKTKKFPENNLKALFCKLDEDDSNGLPFDEFIRFIKRYVPPKEKKPRFGLGNNKGVSTSKGFSFIAHGEVETIPTSQYRKELEDAGVELLNDVSTDEAREKSEAKLLELSKKFNDKLNEVRHKNSRQNLAATIKGKQVDAANWAQLFKEVDEDKSGFVTYDEMKVVVRRKLLFKHSELSDEMLKNLWCTLDGDDSDAIEVIEFSAFLRGNVKKILERKPGTRKKPPAGILYRQNQLRKKVEKKVRPPFDREAYAKEQEAAHAKRLAALESRLRDIARTEREMQEEKMRRINTAKRNNEFKKSLLDEMRASMLRSPIPLEDQRIGGTRIVPLYQTERMLLQIERARGGKTQWPGSPRPTSPASRPFSPGAYSLASPGTPGSGKGLFSPRSVPAFDLRPASASRRIPLPGNRRPTGEPRSLPMSRDRDREVLLDAALGRLHGKLMTLSKDPAAAGGGKGFGSPNKRSLSASASLPTLTSPL